MNFELKNGLIWISFFLNYEGNEIEIDNCIVDTGSATTAIDIDLVEFNYSKPANIKRLIGVGGGTQEVISQNVNKVILDQKEIKNLRN